MEMSWISTSNSVISFHLEPTKSPLMLHLCWRGIQPLDKQENNETFCGVIYITWY